MFYFDDFYGKKVLKSDLLQDIDCFFTTREFVLTNAAREDLKKEAEYNRGFLKNKLSCKEITTAKQVHGTNISIVTKEKFFYDNTDALISNIEGSVLLMNFADCVPIILYSNKYNTGAIIHAGWRGTAAEIAKKTVQKIKKDLNIPPEEITALIGPSIGKCCFETGEDVYKQLISDDSKKELYEEKNGKYFIDLKLINRIQLEEEGITNIDMSDYCTCCMSGIFFSYRKEKGITARHSAIIKIKRG